MTLDKNPASQPVDAACSSHVGRVRQQNEDHCLVAGEQNLFIVSDGMGGHQAGEVASQVVITVLPAILAQQVAQVRMPSTKKSEWILRDTIVELSQRLRAESIGRVGLQGLGATVAVAWVQGTIASLAHMGDSRIYLLRQGELTQLTEDHSLIALLLGQGEITLEEAQTHPARGQVSRYIGMEGDVAPDVRTLQLQADDRLLLCTDGLTNMVPDAQIRRLLQLYREPEAACQALVQAANAAGGVDNVTALVVNCGEETRTP